MFDLLMAAAAVAGVPEPPMRPQTGFPCDRCLGLGKVIAPSGIVATCPTIIMRGRDHYLSPAGHIISRAVDRLQSLGAVADATSFEIARTLSRHSRELPCSRRELIDRHFDYVSGPDAPSRDEHRRRAVSKAIESLRNEWRLPVCSRKDRPSGYWIATGVEDFAEFFDRACREPITHLSTLHRMAKANWPVFAEQIELDFWEAADGEE